MLGTPTENSWRGVTKLKGYSDTIPNWAIKAINKDSVKDLDMDEDALELLNVLFH